MNVLIIGASRGLGLEFVRQYQADGATVTATARDDAGLAGLTELGAHALRLDVTDAASTDALGRELAGKTFDVAIVNAGANAKATDSKGSSLSAPSEEDFDWIMRTNVLGPMRVVAQIAASLAPGAKLAILSSRMGSIGTRTAGANSLYRASKSAVNSVLKDTSLVLGAKAVCIAFHPGWVRTDMGGAGADLDAATSVAGMRKVVAGLKPKDTGGFFNYDGETIAW